MGETHLRIFKETAEHKQEITTKKLESLTLYEHLLKRF